MAKTANINLRIEPSTKAQAEELFSWSLYRKYTKDVQKEFWKAVIKIKK